MKTIALSLLLCVPCFASKKAEHVPYKIGKYVATTSPVGYAKKAVYPVKHPIKTLKFLF